MRPATRIHLLPPSLTPCFSQFVVGGGPGFKPVNAKYLHYSASSGISYGFVLVYTHTDHSTTPPKKNELVLYMKRAKRNPAKLAKDYAKLLAMVASMKAGAKIGRDKMTMALQKCRLEQLVQEGAPPGSGGRPNSWPPFSRIPSGRSCDGILYEGGVARGVDKREQKGNSEVHGVNLTRSELA